MSAPEKVGPRIPDPAPAPAAVPVGSVATRSIEWSVRTVLDAAGFAAVEGEWGDLHARSVGAGPFQAYPWLASWWAGYGRPGRLRVVLVHADGRLVAAAALALTRRGPFRVLVPLGGGQSDYHDVLVDRDLGATAARRLAAALRALPGWDALDLAEVRAGSAAELLYAAWTGARRRSSGAMCLELPVGTFAEFIARLPKNGAKTAKRKQRKIQQCPIESRQVPAAEVPAAVDGLLELHHGQWTGRSIAAEHLRPRFRRHLATALTGMVESGQAVVTEYRLDGRLVIVDAAVAGPEYVGTYLAGFDPTLREHVDIAMLMLTRALGEVEKRGLPTLSLLRGDEPYKAHWRPEQRRNQRLLLGRSAPAGAYAGLVGLRRAAADATRERYPRLREARIQARSALGRLRSGGRP